MRKIFPLIFLLSSCVMDKVHQLAVIKNESSKSITVIFNPTDSIDDETLFYGSKYTINADCCKGIYVLGYNYKKIHFFIFETDSVYNNINNEKIKGIIKKSLLQKITVSMDSLKKNDTITYKIR